MGNLETITFAWNFWFVLRKCMWVKTSDFANPIVFTLQTDHAKKKVWHKIQKILHNVCVLKEWNNYNDKRTNRKLQKSPLFIVSFCMISSLFAFSEKIWSMIRLDLKLWTHFWDISSSIESNSFYCNKIHLNMFECTPEIIKIMHFNKSK